MTDFKFDDLNNDELCWLHCEIAYDDEYFTEGPPPLTVEDLNVQNQNEIVAEEIALVTCSSLEEEKQEKEEKEQEINLCLIS